MVYLMFHLQVIAFFFFRVLSLSSIRGQQVWSPYSSERERGGGGRELGEEAERSKGG